MSPLSQVLLADVYRHIVCIVILSNLVVTYNYANLEL